MMPRERLRSGLTRLKYILRRHHLMSAICNVKHRLEMQRHSGLDIRVDNLGLRMMHKVCDVGERVVERKRYIVKKHTRFV